MGLFTLLMVMLMLSTDDSRIFNVSGTIIQDLIVPLRKNPLSTKEHLAYIRLCSLGAALSFFVISLFFKQLDYIFMFTRLMFGVWMAASGPIIIGGLYSRFGTTCGAWGALIFGSGTATAGMICQRNWADIIYPWLERVGFVKPIGDFLAAVSSPFHPYVVWVMDPIKFPINALEIYFLSIIFAFAAYIIGSLITYKEPYNLDRLFHRGKYSDENSIAPEKNRWTLRSVGSRLVGISSEHTTGDKIIAWSVFAWFVVYTFVIMFCGVLLWNAFLPWPAERWGKYFFITVAITVLVIGIVSTVWFLIGGIIDARALFRDLKRRVSFDKIEGQSDQRSN